MPRLPDPPPRSGSATPPVTCRATGAQRAGQRARQRARQLAPELAVASTSPEPDDVSDVGAGARRRAVRGDRDVPAVLRQVDHERTLTGTGLGETADQRIRGDDPGAQSPGEVNVERVGHVAATITVTAMMIESQNSVVMTPGRASVDPATKPRRSGRTLWRLSVREWWRWWSAPSGITSLRGGAGSRPASSRAQDACPDALPVNRLIRKRGGWTFAAWKAMADDPVSLAPVRTVDAATGRRSRGAQ